MEILQSVKPGKNSIQFLTFPFKECAKFINNATDGLTVFDTILFKFQDDGEELHCRYLYDLQSYSEEKVIPFELMLVHCSTYNDLKDDVEKKDYKHLFNDELKIFVFC